MTLMMSRKQLEALNRFNNGKGKLTFVHTEFDFGTVEYTLDELLEYINADHSDEWQDYDRSDWMEGLLYWTDLMIANEE